MPVEQNFQKIERDGTTKEEFTVAFTNGALEQLRDLKKFLNAPDELTVVKLGISILQKAKEEKYGEQK